MDEQTNNGPLSGIRVLDMSRILAGPSSSQLLGDLGADVIKIERPGSGDDTRGWGPPWLKDDKGKETRESAYYLCTNRNKRSLTIDFTKPEGQKLLKELASRADVLIENFKVGGLQQYGLDYESLHAQLPELIYCSVTGFGQTGPYAKNPGYDFMIQGMGGIMSITGEPEGEPMKVGVAIVDLMCGMYASVAILGALRYRDQGGGGQHIDLALLDTHAAWLINVGMNYLTSGEDPLRYGNGHANIVPYQPYPASDGYFILTIGNNVQFRKFCDFAEIPEIPDDPRFAENQDRVKNRDALEAIISRATSVHSKAHWLEGLKKLGVPCGPVNTVPEVFEDPQIRHREMEISMDHPLTGDSKMKMIGNPIRYSETPVSYRNPPPMLGQHNREILKDWLELEDVEIERLSQNEVL